jgi:hypothetical protein
MRALARPWMLPRGCESGDEDIVVVVHSARWHYAFVHWKGGHKEREWGRVMAPVWWYREGDDSDGAHVVVVVVVVYGAHGHWGARGGTHQKWEWARQRQLVVLWCDNGDDDDIVVVAGYGAHRDPVRARC